MYDCIIIGAGITGCAAARELSKYKLKTLVLERGHDICSGATKAGGGMIHAGYDPYPGSNKARYNVRGNQLMYPLCDELDVPYIKNGTSVFATDETTLKELYHLQETGRDNDVEVQILTPPEMYEKFPYAGKDVIAMLWAPEGGETDPFEVTFALAENAYANGVEFRKETEVTDIQKKDGSFIVTAAGEKIETKLILNCAGGLADKINDMVSEDHFRIIPRYGAHIVMDRKLGANLKNTVMETPHDLPGGGHTKGMAALPTVGGTMILGCDATELEDPTQSAVPQISIDEIMEYFSKTWTYFPIDDNPTFPAEGIINVFGGCRPHCDRNDFIIGEAPDAPGFFNASGIESPGFTSAPAIAEQLRELVVEKLKPELNENFNPYRKGIRSFRTMTNEERKEAIAENPDYAKIVCRCEMVTEAEIREAIRRPLGARSVAEVKLRTRAGMGRCQGGFCSSRVVEILAEELGISPLEVTQCGGTSQILVRKACGEVES